MTTTRRDRPTARGLYLRHARNDLKNNRAVTIALTLVLILSAFLMATGAMVIERLVGSVGQLFDEAKPPHFLQMHKGDYDPEALARFAAGQPGIDAWLIEEMLGFDSAALTWHRPATGESGSFADSLIDNLFVTQNEEFDFLLDQTGAIPDPDPGEVYLPVAYQQRFALQPDDLLRIRTDVGVEELRVEGFVRDAQMASSMSSATRFLVSESDHEALERAGGGAGEIIVEYRLADPAQVPELQRAYESDDALPKNGQAVTDDMIRIINAISDGLVAIALMFVSLLLIAIALLSVRFVIRGTLEDEVREIGAMRAIGLPAREIARLYLAKYGVMTLIACLVGGALAVGVTTLLTRGIQANYAVAPVGMATLLVPVFALVLVYLIVIVICRRVLGSIRRLDVVGALVHGSTIDARRTARRARRQSRRVRRDRLASVGRGGLNRRLMLLDLRAEGRQWLLLPVVFFLAAVLMTLPLNLLTTFESPRFVTYMGAPESSLRADLQFSDDVDAVRPELLAALQGDDRITEVRAFAGVLYETEGEEGWETLRVEIGDHSGGTIRFLHGLPPADGEIALSVLNADKYGMGVGDELPIRTRDGSMTAVVSGIYQDVTSGGLTAKMQGEVTSGATGYVVYADTVAGVDPAGVAAEYDEGFPTASVIPMREYVQQTLSYVTDALRGASILALVFAIGVAVLITTLFLELRLRRDRGTMGVLSAIGFSIREIVAQIRGKTFIAIACGTLLGSLFAATAGEAIVGAVISLAGMGIARLEFIPNPWIAYVAYPVLLTGAGYLAAVALTARLRGTDRSVWLR